MWLSILVFAVVQSMDFDDASANLHLEMGNAFLEQGLVDQAEEEFNQVLEMEGEYPEALLGLGTANMIRESWSAAVDHLTSYTLACPEDYRGFHQLSILYLRIGNPDSALIMSDSAFTRDPMNPDLWLQSGRVSLALGDMDSAEQWFSRGLEEESEKYMEFLVLLASVYRRTERGQEARTLLLPAVEGGDTPACWELARVYLGWGDYLRAQEAMDRYLMLSPDGYYADSARIVMEELAESGEFIQ